MKTLSVGLPSTLGSYLELTKILFPVGSPAITFLEKKIAKSPNGADEEVIADESQMLHILMNTHDQKGE